MNHAQQLDLNAMMAPFYQALIQRMPFVFVFMVAVLFVKLSLRIIADRCAHALGGRPRRPVASGRTVVGVLLLPVSLAMLCVGLEGAMPGSVQGFVTGVTHAWGS